MSEKSDQLQAVALTFIEQYINSIKKPASSDHNVGTAIIMPEFPIGSIAIQQLPSQNRIIATIGSDLTKPLFDLLQDREKLNEFLANQGEKFRSITICEEDGKVVFHIEHDWYSLDFYTFIREKDRKDYRKRF
jgi:hypothetical protein